MKITFLGTGTGIPQDRVQSGLIVEVNTHNQTEQLLFDCGCGVLQRIFESGYDHKKITKIFLTHLHLDHVSDLLGLLKANWLVGLTSAQIFGPQGTEDWYNTSMSPYSYIDKIEVTINELKPNQTLIFPDYTITTAATLHSVSSLAYKVENQCNTIVYTGDTEPCDSVMELAQLADVLIHECSFPLEYNVDNHTTPQTLATSIKKHNLQVKNLYLTHVYPQMRDHEKETLEYIKKIFPYNIEFAYDLLKIHVDIEKSKKINA